MNPGRYLHTAMYLKPSQVIALARNRLLRKSLPAIPDVELREPGKAFAKPIAGRPELTGRDTVCVLGSSLSIAGPGSWNDPRTARLYLYHLHYHDDLAAADSGGRTEWQRALISKWLDENPPPDGAGWEPYPCSRRIVNWIKWHLAGNRLDRSQLESLALQAAWLHANIEWHLRANHLFANAVALVFAGLFFSGDAADRWLQSGLEILGNEVDEQFLEDGGHFERSPMYHNSTTADLLDLVNAARAWESLVPAPQLDSWRAAAERALTWSAVMRHPDGRIPLFNDSAFGVAPAFAELQDYARRLGIDRPDSSAPLHHAASSGYVRAECGPAVAFVDVGEIGPDYMPGHAHADTLSFELSLFGKRFIVDTGCSTYETGDERARQRGTGAHNTVTVDGEDSSEVWASFRVARRARPMRVDVSRTDGDVVISGAHDGYLRLPGRVVHGRTFRLGIEHLEITDHLDGRFTAAEARFLLHPALDVALDGNACRIEHDDNVARVSFQGGTATLAGTTWNPEFGVSRQTKQLRVAMRGTTLTTRFEWNVRG